MFSKFKPNPRQAHRLRDTTRGDFTPTDMGRTTRPNRWRASEAGKTLGRAYTCILGWWSALGPGECRKDDPGVRPMQRSRETQGTTGCRASPGWARLLRFPAVDLVPV